MKILCSQLYEQQLKEILTTMASSDYEVARKFKLYLDTIILNIPTKAKKYKQSLYSSNEDVKDVEHENYTIPFLFDKSENSFVILAILKK